ncbi:hypothetical protein K503DRAFT_864391 [Rhizopogon vinicolor AM-OR11-026]|uniref:DUF6533 domain-containing protein n=1 Tax=Rhizopogon vinicolor AM-OR11-026 TaxID=1314800 RepID=A0A1B7N7D5_9AGAM|nr:hypothetical protein K503DRAFT_864391 [Rhizopogon vinicolor AM-OR11-026]
MSDLQAQQAILVAIASFTVLCWDHMITFADEIDLIWYKRKGLSGYLFLLNRYITPLGFVVNIVALTLPTWFGESCRYFIRYEGAMATIGIGIAQLMMLLRVHALYPGRRLAIAIPALLLLAWLALQACLMAHGDMVPNTQQDHSCREVYDSPPGLSVTRAWIPLAYDTVIFVMTVWRTLPSNRNREIGRILPTLLSDGTLYYIVICSVNLILTVMIVRAPPALKGVSAQLAFL